MGREARVAKKGAGGQGGVAVSDGADKLNCVRPRMRSRWRLQHVRRASAAGVSCIQFHHLLALRVVFTEDIMDAAGSSAGRHRLL